MNKFSNRELLDPSSLKHNAHVYFLSIENSDSLVVNAANLTILSPHEQNRFKRFHFDKDRNVYYVSHFGLRIILAHYLDCKPEDIEFETGEFGKPEISHPKTSLRFNLSHTDGLIAVIVADTIDCGVDVESTHKVRKFDDLAHHVFAPQEVAVLAQLTEDEQRNLFYQYWTLKEAYIKAVGRGIALGLSTFYFDTETTPVTIHYNESFGEKAENWQFGQGNFTELDKHWAWALKTNPENTDCDIKEVLTQCYQF